MIDIKQIFIPQCFISIYRAQHEKMALTSYIDIIDQDPVGSLQDEYLRVMIRMKST